MLLTERKYNRRSDVTQFLRAQNPHRQDSLTKHNPFSVPVRHRVYQLVTGVEDVSEEWDELLEVPASTVAWARPVR